MNSFSTRLLSSALALSAIIALLQTSTLKADSSTTVSVIYAVGDILEFGTYPQAKVTDASLIANLNAQTLQADNTVTYLGSRYKKLNFSSYTPTNLTLQPTAANSYQDENGYYVNETYWFLFQPIKWRVLSQSNGEVLVVAENILDARAYHQTFSEVTWADCALRSWLNNSFFDAAFSSSEKIIIKNSHIANPDNPRFSVDGGRHTADKLFLLSFTEATNSAYGFNSAYSTIDVKRRAMGTDYAKSQGLLLYNFEPYNGNSYWMLRTPDTDKYTVSTVYYNGSVSSTFYPRVNNTYTGVRPAMILGLDSKIHSKLGSKSIIDCEKKIIYGLRYGINNLQNEIVTETGYHLEYVPTPGGFGTGAEVQIVADGKVSSIVDTYTILFFGDVNGDSILDGNDAGMMIDYENYRFEWDPVQEFYLFIAGDLNGDGNVSVVDADILVETENWNMVVDQSTGLAELL